MNVKYLVLMMYLLIMIMVLSSVLTNVNPYTMPLVVATVALLTLGLLMIVAGHYIVPAIKRKWYLGNCAVYKSRYIICETKAPEKVGYAFLKVIPEQPVADMDKERRESFLQTMLGVLSGTQFEAIVAYFTVKDRYGENIKKRLEHEKRMRLMFARKESMSTREEIERINKELRLLESLPTILEGFFIAGVRDYGYDDYEIIRKLETDARALASRLAGVGVEAKVMTGEELRNVLSFMLFGNLTQLTWL